MQSRLLIITNIGSHDGVLVGYAKIATRHKTAISDLRKYKV